MVATKSTGNQKTNTMTRLKESINELAEFFDNSAITFRKALERVVRSQFDEADRVTALNNLQTVIAETMTLSDLLGRRRLLLEVAAGTGGTSVTLPPVLFVETPVFPRLTFLEAVRDLTSRGALEGFNWQQVAELYRTRHAFALARSSDIALTQQVQKAIERFQRRGVTLRGAERVIAEMGDWTTSYAELVYRTNLSTAYTAGRFQQAADPDVAAVIGAFEYSTAGDSDVRSGRPVDSGENHAAANGFVAATTDPIWDTTAPPSGYSCRCTIRMVPRAELVQRDLVSSDGRVERFIPSGFSAYRRHPAFSTSRARQIYG